MCWKTWEKPHFCPQRDPQACREWLCHVQVYKMMWHVTFGNKIWGNWDICLITRSSLKDVSSVLASLCFSKRPCFCRHEVTRELQLITAYACLFLKLVIPTAMEKTNQPANKKNKINQSYSLDSDRRQLNPVSEASTFLLTWVQSSHGVGCGCTRWQCLGCRTQMNELRWLLVCLENSWCVSFPRCTVQSESIGLSLSLLLAGNRAWY